MKAPASGIKLDDDDAALAKGMLERGDRQHDIAAWFGVNSGRIAEISTGARFDEIEPATDGLPPQGPYTSGKNVYEVKNKLSELRDRLNDMMGEIDTEITKLSEKPEIAEE